MDYSELISQHCPAPYVAEARGLNAASPAGEDALWDMLANPDASDACRSALLAYLSDRIGPDTASGVLGAYFTYATRAAKAHDGATMERIASAAARVDIEAAPEIAPTYFGALRALRIDVRPALSATLATGWGAPDPRDATWQYHLYLADLGTPGAMDALAKRLAATVSGNDATNLINSLATLRSPAAKKVIEGYRDDQRRATGTEGPGLSIAQTVEILLRTWPQQ